jgi:hypothetical protein
VDPLAPRSTFFRRLGSNLALALLLVVVSLFVGMVGYHSLGKLAWIDAFLNASMILSGMGPVDPLPTSGAKLFAGLYALYSGLTLVATASLILAPVLHRCLHWFHITDERADPPPSR